RELAVEIGPHPARRRILVIDDRIRHARVEQQSLDRLVLPAASLIGQLSVDQEAIALDRDNGLRFRHFLSSPFPTGSHCSHTTSASQNTTASARGADGGRVGTLHCA